MASLESGQQSSLLVFLQIVSQGAPVHVTGQGDLSAALAYGNHSSSRPFSPHILEKIVEDVSMGRAFVFPREFAESIPGIRVSPVMVAEPTPKIRICHDLTNTRFGSSVTRTRIDRFTRTLKLDTCSDLWCGGFSFCTLNSLPEGRPPENSPC